MDKIIPCFFVNGKNSPYHIRVYILVIYLTRWSMYHYSIIIPKVADIFRVTITFRKLLNYTTCICHATRTTLFSTRTQFMIFFSFILIKIYLNNGRVPRTCRVSFVVHILSCALASFLPFFSLVVGAHTFKCGEMECPRFEPQPLHKLCNIPAN